MSINSKETAAAPAEIRCPYCRATVVPDKESVCCATCDTLQHVTCWDTNAGCSLSGCGATVSGTAALATHGEASKVAPAKKRRAMSARRESLLLLSLVVLVPAAALFTSTIVSELRHDYRVFGFHTDAFYYRVLVDLICIFLSWLCIRALRR